MISVEVNDPDAWPFIAHARTDRGNDIPGELIASASAKKKAQVEAAIGAPLTELAFNGFAGAYSSALIHDVNAVHGILDVLGVPDGEIVGAQIFAGGDGGQGAVRLLGGQALWTMTHLTVPGLADYKERITLFFDDAMLELGISLPLSQPSPDAADDQDVGRARGYRRPICARATRRPSSRNCAASGRRSSRGKRSSTDPNTPPATSPCSSGSPGGISRRHRGRRLSACVVAA